MSKWISLKHCYANGFVATFLINECTLFWCEDFSFYWLVSEVVFSWWWSFKNEECLVRICSSSKIYHVYESLNSHNFYFCLYSFWVSIHLKKYQSEIEEYRVKPISMSKHIRAFRRDRIKISYVHKWEKTKLPQFLVEIGGAINYCFP